ncbi:MAG: HAD hydrolase family protein, partial [Clostridiales bacterium]|nr:HAD hydrolase family protein [Clostridiales bacterium]MDY5468851.1 HAD hydrolase family protein [Eubacteriales bacterium]
MNTNARAIFLDIDGTLIPFGAEAPCEQDRTALLRARAAGHKVLINTGRSSGFLPPVLRTADYLDGFLCGCGTQLIIGGKTLFKQEIPREALRQVL